MEIKPLVIGELLAKIPVIQGGMGVGISLSGLASAVARQGGIGIISTAQIGYREADYDKNPLQANLGAIRTELEKAKRLAPWGIIGVNIMVATKGYEEYVRVAVEAGADVIISGAGLPVNLPALVEKGRTKIAPIVSSEKALEVIGSYWSKKYHRIPDFVVVEGPRAGGHLGFKEEELMKWSTSEYDMEIQNIIAKAKEIGLENGCEVPVIIAGGIYNREDMMHYLEMGADGVQMGTRFVTTYECDADIRYKNAYLKALKEDIVIVKSPVGMPGRAIYNEFLRKTQRNEKKITTCHQCLAKCNPAQIPYCISDALIQAAKGNTEEGLIFCGDNAYRAEKLEYVADIMKEFI